MEGDEEVGERKTAFRCFSAATIIALSAAGASLVNGSVAADGTGPAFHNSGLSGGGFISVLAQSASGTLIAGGDTQGLFRSVDGAETWAPEDAGLPASGYHVAALLAVGGVIFAAVGDGGNGGVAESLDDGVTWREFIHAGASTPPDFDGANLPGQSGHPRATGDLLATDGTFLYAAAFGRGLQRWPLSAPSLGNGWQCVALCTSFLNSMALDGRGDAFVSLIARTGASRGVDEVTGLGSHPATKALSLKNGVSTGVQELISLGARVYTAGANGIGYWSGGKWSTLDSSAHWYTLSGYEVSPGASPVDVLYAATYSGHGANDVERLVVTGTAEAIAGLSPRGSVGTTIYGSGLPWWEATSAGRAGQNLGPEAMVGGCPSSSSALCAGNTVDFFTGSSVLVLARAGVTGDVLLVGGRSGVWHDDPSVSPPWLPAVTGLASTFDLDIAVDPADGADVAVADADWNVLASTDDLSDIDTALAPPLFAATNGTGYAVTWDASVSPSALIAAGGDRSRNTHGSIWYDATWAIGGAWAPVPLPAGVTASPIAVAATATTTPGVYVLVAAFQKTGVYAFTGSGTSGSWALVAPGPSGGPTVSPGDPHGVRMAWAVDGHAVFMYDAGTHALWTSAFDGSSFAPWAKLYADGSPTPGRGWVAADPAAPSVVWVSNTNGLGYIDTSVCPSLCAPNWVTPAAGGPLASTTGASGDYVYMAGGGGAPAFTEVQVTLCASTCPVATAFVDPYYEQVAGNAIAMATGADGGVYVATLGNGVTAATAP